MKYKSANFLMIITLALVCGCDIKYYTSGVILNEEKVLKIIPGKSKIDDIVKMLGLPSVLLEDEKKLYAIYSGKIVQHTGSIKKEIQRSTHLIIINKKTKLIEKIRKTDDSNDIIPAKQRTKLNYKKPSYIKDIFKSTVGK